MTIEVVMVVMVRISERSKVVLFQAELRDFLTEVDRWVLLHCVKYGLHVIINNVLQIQFD